MGKRTKGVYVMLSFSTWCAKFERTRMTFVEKRRLWSISNFIHSVHIFNYDSGNYIHTHIFLRRQWIRCENKEALIQHVCCLLSSISIIFLKRPHFSRTSCTECFRPSWWWRRTESTDFFPPPPPPMKMSRNEAVENSFFSLLLLSAIQLAEVLSSPPSPPLFPSTRTGKLGRTLLQTFYSLSLSPNLLVWRFIRRRETLHLLE